MNRFFISFMYFLFFTSSVFADGLDAEELFLEEFIKNEATFQNQKIQIARANHSKPFTIGFILSNILGYDLPQYKEMCIMATSWTSDTTIIVTGNNDILACDITDFYRGQEENLTFTLWPSEGDTPLVIFPRIIGGLKNQYYYYRVSLMIPTISKEDDLRTFNSNGTPTALSFVAVYDVTDPTDRLTQYQKIYEGAVEKTNTQPDATLTKTEEELIAGIREFRDPSYYLGYGDWLKQQNRYYDSMTMYKRALSAINVYQLDVSTLPIYYQLCYDLANCYHNIGMFDEAFYYMNLAHFGGKASAEEVNHYYDVKNKNIMDMASSYTSSSPTLGYALHRIFNIKHEEVTNMLICKNGKVIKKETGRDVFDTKIAELCDDKTVLAIRYSKNYYQTGNETDKSILCGDNSAIMYIYRIPREAEGDSVYYRLCTMIPNFRNDDDKHSLEEVNMPQYLSFIVPTFSNLDLKKSTPKDILKKCHDMNRRHNHIEALLTEDAMYAKLLTNKDQKSEVWKDYNFLIGSSMMELGKGETAYNFLGMSMPSDYQLYTEEYINCLNSCKDIRILSEIEKYENSTFKHKRGSKESFSMFIKRRKAYSLIDMGKWDEAETLLKDLKQIPECRDFAEGELKYIESVRNNK